jgi:hypothetical protein
MTPLRKRMTEDMQLPNFSPQIQRTYLHHITGLARFYKTSPEHLNLEDLRQFQVYLASQCRYSVESLNQFVSAAKFLYGVKPFRGRRPAARQSPYSGAHHSQPARN